MSGRRTSGRTRPSLGVQVLAVFSFLFPRENQAVQEMSGRTSGSPRHPSSRHPRPICSFLRYSLLFRFFALVSSRLFLEFFFVFFSSSPRTRANNYNLLESRSDPVCTDPIQNLPTGDLPQFQTASGLDLTQRARGSKKIILARTHEKTIPPRTKFSFSLEIFILGLKISFSIENFNPKPCFSAAGKVPGMKISFSIENFIPCWKLDFFNIASRDWIFSILGPLWGVISPAIWAARERERAHKLHWDNQRFREMPPGLLQHVLTVLVFWSWFLLLPRLPPWSRSLRLPAWAGILLYGPLEIAWMCCPQLPHHPCKNGTHGTCFCSTGGHTPRDWEKLNRGVSKPGCFPLFSGKVQIASRTRDESGNSPDRPRANRENPRKIGKVPKRTKKEGQVQIGKPPPFETPPFSGPWRDAQRSSWYS